MSEYAEPRVNIRSRFDFDDYAPVQGLVFDEDKEKAKAALWHFAISNLAAIVVGMAGFWTISWWVHGGFMWAWWLFAKYAPGLLHMAMTGQV